MCRKAKTAFPEKAAELQTEGQGSKSEVERMIHQDMPDNIKALFTEFSDDFLGDLPPALPPVLLGHQFEIELQDDVYQCIGQFVCSAHGIR